MTDLEKIISSIEPIDEKWFETAQAKLDSLTKPPGSLGRLEDLARQVVAITEDPSPQVSPKLVCTFAGDHGIVAEGVSAFPSEVTPQMVLNFLAGGAGINVLARHFGAEVWIIDVGVAAEFEDAPGLIKAKVAPGTANMAQGPAMTDDQARAAVKVGIDVAFKAADQGFRALATGEMGIGNTTPATAITAVFTGLPTAELTGRGTGLTDDGLKRKAEIIDRVLEVNHPQADDPWGVLAKVGGYEIAAIAGLCLGGAARRRPVVIDGFISTAGALVAAKICPAAADYMIASHQSVEIGHRAMLEHLGLKPLVDLDLRLGEGTGAAVGLSLVEAAVKILNEMATFDSAGVTGDMVE